MKRCSNCSFPNTDSDKNCFKCGAVLPEAVLPEEGTLDFSPNTSFDTNTNNVTDFIHSPIEDTTPGPCKTIDKTEEEVCVTSDPMPLETKAPPPPASAVTSLSPPTRILPKYKSLNLLSLISKLIGIILGLTFMSLSISFLVIFPSILSIATCIIGVGLGIFSMLIGFILGAVLIWLNDAECNQRKQIELINHIYDTLPKQM